MFLENIKLFVETPIEVIDEEYRDLYASEILPPFVQKVQKMVGMLVLRTAQELSNALNGLDKRNTKASKVAGKSGKKEELEETAAKRVLILKKGMEHLRALQQR